MQSSPELWSARGTNLTIRKRTSELDLPRDGDSEIIPTLKHEQLVLEVVAGSSISPECNKRPLEMLLYLVSE